MPSNKNNLKPFFLGVLMSALVGVIIWFMFFSQAQQTPLSLTEAEPEPMYWVAPMDDNYRRDKPGLSPMGMELVAVYKNTNQGKDEGPGTISISPEVVNNLGVRLAVAEYKMMHNQIDTVGYVNYDEDKLIHVHPRVQGWIEKLYIKSSGAKVQKGQALYDIYSPELVNAQEELVLAISRNNSRLIRAAENRLLSLNINNATIKKLKSTKKVQQTLTVYAPQSGVVENLTIREGFYVQPGTPILSIGDLSQVWVEAEVFESQVFDVRAGDKVNMTLDYLPGKVWHGTVDYVFPVLNASTRTLTVRLKFINENGDLKPNMFANVSIHPSNDRQMLLIPKEALIRTGSQDRVVLALGDGRFKSITVEVGKIFRTSVEIISGLNTGEAVVSSAQFLLDSESSKSSDFKRMHVDTAMADTAMADINDTETVSSATTTGIVNAIMVEHRMLNISRGAIEEWGRPAATVDFISAENVDISTLSQGTHIEFTFVIKDGEFLLTEFSIVDDKSTDTIQPDHSGH
ncbi:efflux RND transporter periplasmic adaptor subunit [Colwelliaceae bacterium BS250]